MTTSPSPAPPAYWSMELSDLATSSRSHREPPCAIHGLGSCPYPVVRRRMVLSSPSTREGEREGEEEEGVVDVEDVVEVVVAEEEDDEPVEVIPVPESRPRRMTYKQRTRIRIGPWGQSTGPLAPRTNAREISRDSPEIGSAVWPPPPPSPSSGASSTVIPRSEKEGTMTPYVCPGYSNHTHGNNMITRCNIINKRVIFLT
jgi:hypothetical protein